MARASKSRRGQRRQGDEPEAHGQDRREEQPSEPEAGAPPEGLPETDEAAPPRQPAEGASPEEASPEEASPEETSPEEAGPEEASAEAPLDDEARRETDLEAPAAAADDELPPADEPLEPGVATDEPEMTASEPEPEPAYTEPQRTEREPERRSRTWLAAGLILVLAVAAIASGWLFDIYGEGQVGWVTAGRLDAVSQRLDDVAARVESQASRVDAVEQSLEGVRADASQLADRLGALESSLGDVRALAEANAQRLDEVAGSIEQLRTMASEPGDGSGAGAAVSELRATIEALSNRMQELEQGQGQDLSQLSQTIGRLEQEIDELRGQAEEQAGQAQQVGALSQAFAALSERLAAGEPFAEQLEAVMTHLPTAPGLDVLRPLAGNGVATVTGLQAELARIADGLAGGAAEPEETAAADDLWSRIRQELEGAVTVRRQGEADWPAVLGRAEEALQAGNVAAAVNEVEQASQDPPPEIEAWLAEAENRRDADAALDELSAVVLRQLAGQG